MIEAILDLEGLPDSNERFARAEVLWTFTEDELRRRADREVDVVSR